MASLMENLIEVLTKESGAYEGLLDISTGAKKAGMKVEEFEKLL